VSSIIGKVTELNEIFGNLVQDYKSVELIGIVPNRVKEYNKEPKGSQSNILERLYESYGNMVFQNYVTDGDGISSASQMGFPVYGLTGSSVNARKQADAMQAVLCEMLERL